MSQFRITRELLSGYCAAGLTVKEMAEAIRTASTYPCSQEVVRKAAKAYGISLKNKPLKSPFVFGDAPTTEVAVQKVEDNIEVKSAPGVRF